MYLLKIFFIHKIYKKQQMNILNAIVIFVSPACNKNISNLLRKEKKDNFVVRVSLLTL